MFLVVFFRYESSVDEKTDERDAPNVDLWVNGLDVLSDLCFFVLDSFMNTKRIKCWQRI